MKLLLCLSPLLGVKGNDPCTAMHPDSKCEELVCVSLLWIDSWTLTYTFDPSNLVSGTEIYCDDAEQVQRSDSEATPFGALYREFNIELARSMMQKRGERLAELVWSFNRFPLISPQQFERDLVVMGELYRMVTQESPNALESQVANQHITRLGSFRSLLREVQAWIPVVATVSVARESHAQLEIFANWVSLLEDIEPTGFAISVSLHDAFEVKASFPTRYMDDDQVCQGGQSFNAVLPLVEGQPERAVEMLDNINSLVDFAITNLPRFKAGFRMDIGIVSPHFSSVQLLHEAVKLLSHANHPSANTYKILKYEFEKRICPNMVAVAHVLIAATGEYYIKPKIGHTVSTMAQLCIQLTSAEERVQVSMISKGSSRFNPQYIYISSRLFFHRNHIDEDSDRFLRDFSVVAGRDWFPVMEGGEDVGYIGPRKEWVSRMIGRYFRVDSRFGIWQFTDDSRRFISLIDGDALNADQAVNLRAAGRVFGFALRYEVPMGVWFAPSFIKALRLLYNPDVDLDALLVAEDPSFLNGLEWVGQIDWADPPVTAKWQTFDALKWEGGSISLSRENAQEFIHLSKVRKLFTSKRESLKLLRQGITEVVGAGVFGMLTEDEITGRLCRRMDGFPHDLLIAGIVYRNIDESNVAHVQIRQWIRELIAEWTDEDRFAFHKFVAGMREPPATAETEPWIKLFFEPSLSLESLPRSHTCHNELQMPLYKDKERLKAKLELAIHESGSVEGYSGYATVTDV